MRIAASDRTDTVVVVEPINKAIKSDVKVAERTTVDFSGGQLAVKTTVAGDKNGSVAISIDLLDRVNALQANVAAGEVEVGHVAGGATVEGGKPAVRIGEVEGTVRFTSSAGQIWIGDASADLDLTSGSGGFDIDRADGSVTATTGNGAIRIGRTTRGQAELMNGSGNIEVGISEGTAARVDANSERGSVTPGSSHPESARACRP